MVEGLIEPLLLLLLLLLLPKQERRARRAGEKNIFDVVARKGKEENGKRE